MSCPIRTRENKDLLLAYSAGKLDARQTIAFEAHLSDCAACRDAAAAQNTVWSALDNWIAPPVSADFERRLQQRIEAETTWWDAIIRPFRSMRNWRAVPVAATAALLLVAGFLLERPGALIEPLVPEMAQVEAVAPEQAESALVDMETIREFSSLVHSDAASPRM